MSLTASGETFDIGSYARARTGVDQEGSVVSPSSIATFGSRLELDPYVQIDLVGHSGIDVDLVTSLAVRGDPFQAREGRSFEAELNNVYATSRELIHGLEIWAGARTLIGPEVYLFQLFPIRNLALLGAGAGYALDQLQVDFHLGTTDPRSTGFAVGRETVVGTPATFSTTRTRVVATSQLAYTTERLAFAVNLEAQALPAGRPAPEGEEVESAVGTTGVALGASTHLLQVGSDRGHVALHARVSQGLAAYNLPFGACVYDGVSSAAGAREGLLATGGNLESGPLALLFASYYRYFRGSEGDCPFDEQHEGSVALRPQWFIIERAGVAVEVSHQVQHLPSRNDGLPQLTRVSLLPFVSPLGRGSFQRPLLYAEYAVARRNDAARGLYEPEDGRTRRSVDHQFILGVEWWLGSTVGGTPLGVR